MAGSDGPDLQVVYGTYAHIPLARPKCKVGPDLRKGSMVFTGRRGGYFSGDPGSEFSGDGGSHLEVNECPTWTEAWKKTQDVPDPLRSLDCTNTVPAPSFLHSLPITPQLASNPHGPGPDDTPWLPISLSIKRQLLSLAFTELLRTPA